MKDLRACIRAVAAVMATIATINVADSPVPSHIFYRSPSQDTVVEVVGMHPFHIHLPDKERSEDIWWTLFFEPKYQQTFRPVRIARSLFGDVLVDIPSCETEQKKGHAIIVSGSDVTDRASTDLMAENFYLPSDFKSILTFNPKVQTFSFNLNLYIGLDRWLEGLYICIYGPYVWARNDLGFYETIVNAGTEGYPAGYFDRVEVPADNLLHSFEVYARGEVPSGLPDNEMVFPQQTNIPVDAGRGAGDSITIQEFTLDATDPLTLQGLNFARIEVGKISKSGFSDLRIALGYEIFQEEDYNLGVELLAVLPTDPYPDPRFLFEPQIGNDHHVEFGATAHGHYTLWRCEEKGKKLDIVFDGQLSHMFNNNQCRTFDLVGKGLSRYMLAEKMTTDFEAIPLAVAPAPAAVGNVVATVGDADQFADIIIDEGETRFFFAREFAPVANFTTVPVTVGVAYQIDFTGYFNYSRQWCCSGFSWDLGVNVWYRSCEDINFRDRHCDDFPEQTWALKGNGNVYGFVDQTTTNLLITEPNQANLATAITNGNAFFTAAPGGYPIGIPDDASHSTIQYGSITGDDANPEITSGSYAINSPDTLVLEYGILNHKETTDAIDVATGTPIQTVLSPDFITLNDLDLCAAGTRGISCKIFTHFNYTCMRRENWFPYIGIGGEAEFGRGSDGAGFQNSKPGCRNAALSQWGVWIKLGLSYH